MCEAPLKGDLLLRGVHPLEATKFVESDVLEVYPDGGPGENGKHSAANLKLLKHNETMIMKSTRYQAECDARCHVPLGIDFAPGGDFTDGGICLSEGLCSSW